MTNIVTCEFLGRLGNNLFQVAACIGYSKHYNIPWGILPGYHHPQIYSFFKLPVYRGNPRGLKVYDTATDEGFPYKQIPQFNAPGVKIRGFWQSYKYFDHAKEEVLKAWNLRYHPEFKGAISIHVRRGDYVTHSDYFPPITKEYVSEALTKVPTASATRVVVFSDDIPWCKETWGNQFEYIEGGTEYSDLSMMASCDHNIIANSSFSWVAAYANTNPDKIVVSPHHQNWFGLKNRDKLDTKDLLPTDWTQIKFR